MRKGNRKMQGNAVERADKRFSGGQKILKLLARGSRVDSGPNGMWQLQQQFGI